jgi:hypothetical protein
LSKRPGKVFIVAGDVSARARQGAQGRRELTSKLPILVLEATAATPEYIRAGASDVAPPGATHETVCKQIVRLIRRGR